MLLLRLLTRRRVAAIAEIKSTLEAQRSSLMGQLEATAIDADFDLSDESRAAFADLAQQFRALRSCRVIWDISESVRVDRVRTRSAASESVRRHRVSFEQVVLDAIDSDFESLHLRNANGGDLFLFPYFLAVQKTAGSFALIDIRQLELSVSSARFIEDEALPGDSERIGSAWERSNKDGSPDRRFANNRQIPVVRYGQLFLSSTTGLNEAYMVSNARTCESFDKAFQRYIAALPTRVSGETETSAPLIESPPLEIPERPHIPGIMSGGAWAFVSTLLLCVGFGVALQIGTLTLPASTASSPLIVPESAPSPTPQEMSSGVRIEPTGAVPSRHRTATRCLQALRTLHSPPVK